MVKTAEKADKAAEKGPDQATERAPERTTDETIVSGQGFTGAVPDVPPPGEEVLGGTNRNSEGFYGEKTRELVRTAYRDLLGRENPEGRFDWDLLNVLRGMGAPVEG
jgi:hypothetical protein